MLTDKILVESSIEQATHILEEAYTKIILETDVKTLTVNDAVFKNFNPQKAVDNLHKIAGMCRRLEIEIREYSERKGL